MKSGSGFAVIGVLFSIFAIGGVASATTYDVYGGGSIQSAINNAMDGDTIYVHSATYTEQITVTKSVVLRGDSSINTFLAGGFYVSANGATIENFNISGGYSWSCLPSGDGLCKAGIYSISDNNIFRNNYIHSILAGNGIYAVNDNNDGGTAVGIYLFSSDNNIIDSNSMANITGGNGANVDFQDSEVISSGFGGTATGIYLKSSNNNQIKTNNILKLYGGNGGASNPSQDWHYGGHSSGEGGRAIGIYFVSSTDNAVRDNTIASLTGGKSGSGSAWEAVGVGGVPAGFYLESSIRNTFRNNSVASLQPGLAGTYSPYGGTPGPNGVATAVWIKDYSSIDNKITPFLTQGSYKIPDSDGVNTADGKPIIYAYGETGMNISSYSIDLIYPTITIGTDITTAYKQRIMGGAGGVSTGIALLNVYNSIIKDNTVSNFVGLPGGTGGRLDLGGKGSISAGIYVYASENNNLNNNVINSITGGSGGASSVHASAGAGGTSTGIYLELSRNNILFGNSVSNMIGGYGGDGGNDGVGAVGGIATGFYLNKSIGNILQSNVIINLIRGNKGNAARNGGEGNWGVDGIETAMWLDSSNDNTITSLITQGSYKIPDSSKLNTINNVPILYVYGQTNVNIANFDITGNVAPVTLGGSIQTGPSKGVGGQGGLSIGLGLINTNNSIIDNVTISDFKAMPGGSVSYQGKGGTGGSSAAIYIFSSYSNDMKKVTISNLTGGDGGNAGQDAFDYGGNGGNSIGIFFQSSDENKVYTTTTITNLNRGTRGFGDGGSGLDGATYTVYENASQNNLLNYADNSVAMPSFSPASGTYPIPQTVTITTTTSGASIYYTTDGSEPTQSSTLYSAPISISSTTTLKAKAWKTGLNESSTATAAYTVYMPVLTSITVSPSAASVGLGAIQQFTAQPKDQFGNPYSTAVTWTSSNTTVGTITQSGLFSALAAGTTTITARNGSINGTAIATVVVPQGGNPVAYYRFDDGTASDSSGSNHGTIYGATPTIGKIGNALQFDGTDDYVQTTSEALKTANNFTITAWFKADNTNALRHIIWQGDGTGNGGGTEEELGISIGDTTTGQVDKIAYFIEGTNDDIIVSGATGSFTDTNWNFIAITANIDTSAPSGELFLNGVLKGTDTSDTITRANWGNLRIGRPGTATRLFDGSIDEVKIYNRSLSAAEIKAEYDAANRAYVNVMQYFYPDSTITYAGAIDGKVAAGITALPVSGNVSVFANVFTNSLVNFSADSSPNNLVAFNVTNLKPNTNYRIMKDGALFQGVQADSTGKITFSNSAW